MTDSSESGVDLAREIRRVHTIIEDGFGGIRDGLSPVADALASEFRYVAPDGTIRDREATIAAMNDSLGTYVDSTPPFTIDIRNVERQVSIYGMHLMTYERHQRIDGDWAGRTSSVWLYETEDTPTGLEWLHLQETPLTSNEDTDENSDGDVDAEAANKKEGTDDI